MYIKSIKIYPLLCVYISSIIYITEQTGFWTVLENSVCIGKFNRASTICSLCELRNNECKKKEEKKTRWKRHAKSMHILLNMYDEYKNFKSQCVIEKSFWTFCKKKFFFSIALLYVVSISISLSHERIRVVFGNKKKKKTEAGLSLIDKRTVENKKRNTSFWKFEQLQFQLALE